MREYYPKRAKKPPSQLKATNPGGAGIGAQPAPDLATTAGIRFTIIDCLLARALAYCLLDLDCAETIADARRLAACAERRHP